MSKTQTRICSRETSSWTQFTEWKLSSECQSVLSRRATPEGRSKAGDGQTGKYRTRLTTRLVRFAWHKLLAMTYIKIERWRMQYRRKVWQSSLPNYLFTHSLARSRARTRTHSRTHALTQALIRAARINGTKC